MSDAPQPPQHIARTPQSDPTPLQPLSSPTPLAKAANYSVARVEKDLCRASTLGIMGSNRYLE